MSVYQILYDNWTDNGVPFSGGGGSSSGFGSNPLQDVFTSLFNILNIQFNYYGYTFTLLDVFKYQLIMIFVGICLVKIWFFACDYFTLPNNMKGD